MRSHQQPLSIVCDILPLAAAHVISLCTVTLSLPDDFNSPLYRNKHNSLLLQCQPCPLRPPALPLNVTDTTDDHDLSGLLTFQVPNVMSVLHFLGCSKNPSKAEVVCNIWRLGDFIFP